MGKFEEKLAQIEQAKQTKLQTLGAYDADSLIFKNLGTGAVGTGRLTETNYFPQAPELKDSQGQILQTGVDAKNAADSYLLGKPTTQFNNNQEIANEVNIGNVQIDPTGRTDVYGRPLYEAQRTDSPVSQTDALIFSGNAQQQQMPHQQLNTILGAETLPVGMEGTAPKDMTGQQIAEMADYADPNMQLLEATGAGFLNLSSRFAETLGSGIKGLGELQKSYNERNPEKASSMEEAIARFLIEEGAQIEKEQQTWRETGQFDDLVGYDARSVQEYGEEFANRVEDGKIIEAIGGLVDPRGVTAFANSGFEMLVMANPAGLGAVMTANINNNLNALENKAKKDGVEVTAGDKATSIGLSMVGTYLDRLGDKAVLGNGVSALKKTLDGMPTAIRNQVMKAYEKPLARLAASAGLVVPKAGFEGGTEWMQTILENKASDKSLQSFSLTDKEKREALEAFGVGMGAGGVPAAATSTKEAVTSVKDTTKKAAGAVKEAVSKGQAKPVEEAVTPLRQNKNVTEDQRKEASKHMHSVVSSVKEGKMTYQQALDEVNSLDIDQEDSITHSRVKIVKDFIKTEMSKNEVPVEDLQLGSEQDAVDFISDLYSTTDKPNATMQANIDSIAKEYNIPTETVAELKTRSSVEQQASVSGIGYRTYGRKLRQLQKNPQANAEQIQKYTDRLYNFESSQKQRLGWLENEVKDIEAQIADGSFTGKKRVVTNPNTGNSYTIHIGGTGANKFVNKATYDTIDDIKRTIQGIQEEMSNAGLTEETEVTPTTEPVQEQVVPEPQVEPTVDDTVTPEVKTELTDVKPAEPTTKTPSSQEDLSMEKDAIEAEQVKEAEQAPKTIEEVKGTETKATQEKKQRNAYAKDAVKNVENIVPESTTDNEVFYRKDSPARIVLFNKDGSVNSKVATAVKAAIQEYIASGSRTFKYKSKEDIARMLSLMEHDVEYALIKFFNEKGMTREVVADSVGSQIVKMLNIKAPKKMDERQYRKLISDLGNTAIIYAESQGWLKSEDVGPVAYKEATGYDTQATVSFVQLGDKYDDNGNDFLKEMSTGAKSVSALWPKDATREKGSFDAPLAPKKKYSIRNNPFTEVPKQAVKALNKLRQIKYKKVYAGIDWISDNKKRAMELMGYKNLDDFDGSFDAKLSQEAKNRQIEDSVDYLLNDMNDEPSFDWFYTKNGRYMIDSNQLNPQTDKLHRFLVVPDNHEVTLSKDNPSHMEKFYYALAQAVGYSVDKKSTTSIINKGKEISKLGSQKLSELLTSDSEVLHDLGIEIEHLGHFLQAIEAVKEFEKEGNEFSVNITAEYDALTSGFGIRLMQLPILGKKTSEWLEKVGVFTGNQITSMNDKIAEKDFFDSYQTLAKQIGSATYKVKGDQNVWKQLAKVLPVASKDGEVTSELRSLFKDPFMTFNYAAGFKSIKNSLSYVIVDDIINQMAQGNKKYKALFMELAKVYGRDLKHQLKTKEADQIRNGKRSLGKELRKMVIESYGKEVEDILTVEFREFKSANKVINETYRKMFDVFKKDYNQALKEAQQEGKDLTRSLKEDIVRNLLDRFPLIKGPLSDDLNSGVPIFDSSKVALNASTDGEFRVATKFKANGKISQSKLWPIIRDLEAAASAGSVIPIHFIDGAVMNALMLKYQDQFIHDAVMPNILESAEVVKEYNKVWFETNKEYSMIEELEKAYNRVTGDTTSEHANNLKELAEDVKQGREELYANDVQVAHMVGLSDSVFETESQISTKQDTIRNKLSEALTEEQIATLKKEMDCK